METKKSITGSHTADKFNKIKTVLIVVPHSSEYRSLNLVSLCVKTHFKLYIYHIHLCHTPKICLSHPNATCLQCYITLNIVLMLFEKASQHIQLPCTGFTMSH